MTGETPTDPIKPKLRIIEAAGDNNNKKKFQFLSAETTPGIFFLTAANCHFNKQFAFRLQVERRARRKKQENVNERKHEITTAQRYF